MEKTLAQLAQYVGGKVKGNADVKITAVATLENAAATDISFLVNLKYSKALQNKGGSTNSSRSHGSASCSSATRPRLSPMCIGR